MNLNAPYSDNVKMDKFYTNLDIAKTCIDLVNIEEYDFIIEPAAGAGSFFNQLESSNKIGLDILPENDNILKQDWFKYDIPTQYEDVLVIGNPPFGKRNLLSKSFIDHACSFENVRTIAFILPDVYNKHTLQNIFPSAFRLKLVHKLPRDSFNANGEEYHVPCSFFIFEKSPGECLRFNPEEFKETKDWKYGNKNKYDFFILGASVKTIKELPSKSNRGYYIKVNDPKNIENVKMNFKSGNWVGFSSVNGGVSWMTKSEIVKSYILQFQNKTKLKELK
ncbi:MAG: hypothetical protein J7L15_02270 [Clostridiales bacterium]|nr:hypothetical protein [Clostridiales bacterium]